MTKKKPPTKTTTTKPQPEQEAPPEQSLKEILAEANTAHLFPPRRHPQEVGEDRRHR